MNPLYRLKAWFIALVPIRPVPAGRRLEGGSGGRLDDGHLAGAIFVRACSALPASEEDSQCG
jgi:hypothetical protein